MDVIKYLRVALRERVARKGEEFKVSWVSGIRDYNAGLKPLQVKVYNAFRNRDGALAPHSFSFGHSGALTTAQADTVEDIPGHAGPNALADVVCCVKEYMRSIDLIPPSSVGHPGLLSWLGDIHGTNCCVPQALLAF